MLRILEGALALGLLWSVMTIGVYLSYRILDIADLTTEGSIVLGASVSAVIIYNGGSPYFAALAATLAGLSAGLCNGLLHTRLKIPPLLSGILVMISLYSINIRVMNKSANISLLRRATVFTGLMNMGVSKNMSAIIIGGIVSTLVILFVYWFLGTEIGSGVRATGDSPNMARAQGVNTDNAKLIGLAMSGALVGLSGALISQYLGFSDVQMGVGSIVIGLASLIIGEVLFVRRGGIFRTLVSLALGAVVYRVIIALVIEAGMPATDLKLFTAVTVAVALCLPQITEAISGRRSRRKQDASD